MPVKHKYGKNAILKGTNYTDVDIYDLVLFSIVRVPSLKALGLSGQELIDTGVFLLNMQMIGMLIGGVIWGVLASQGTAQDHV